MTAAVRVTDCEWKSDGIHIQRIDDKSYLSAYSNKKHVYWSDVVSNAQVFTLDSENWLVTINGTYLEMNNKQDTLWQIYSEYKDDEDTYCVRLEKQETSEEELDEIEDDTDEEPEPEEAPADEIEDDLENLANELENDLDELNKEEEPEISESTTAVSSTGEDGENSGDEKKVKKPKAPSLVAEKNFMDYKREKITDENPDMKKGDITKKLKEMWKELSKEQKKRYYD